MISVMGYGIRGQGQLASCVDTLNTLRNNATPAHPNEDLLDEAEGMLAVNAVRSIFNYLRARL